MSAIPPFQAEISAWHPVVPCHGASRLQSGLSFVFGISCHPGAAEIAANVPRVAAVHFIGAKSSSALAKSTTGLVRQKPITLEVTKLPRGSAAATAQKETFTTNSLYLKRIEVVTYRRALARESQSINWIAE